MKSKEEFTAAFNYELSGILTSAFAQSEKLDFTEKGRFIVHQLRSVERLLHKMHDFIAETHPVFVPKEPTVEEQAEAQIKRCGSVPESARLKVIDKLRVAFTPAQTNGVKK